MIPKKFWILSISDLEFLIRDAYLVKSMQVLFQNLKNSEFWNISGVKYFE